MKFDLSGLALREYTLLNERLNAQSYRYDTPASAGFKKAYENLMNRVDVEAALTALKPWRKGPFTIRDVFVDGEWDCSKKWSRLEPLLPNLTRKKVLDVGGGNGYFSFECAKQGTEWTVCLDPSALYTYQFKAAKLEMPNLPVHFFPLGWQDCDVFENECDVVLCMGVLYHHTDPFAVIKSCKKALKKGGELLLETLVIPGDKDMVLSPKERYAAMRNVYFLPTVKVLKQWCEQLKLEVLAESEVTPTTPKEQRVTPWSSERSLKNFLNPTAPTKTIEGYPAPQRVILKLRK